MKFYPSIQILFFKSMGVALILAIDFTTLFAQKLKITETQKPEPEGFNWGYILILGLGIAFGGAVVWWLSRRESDSPETLTKKQDKNEYFKKTDSFEKIPEYANSKRQSPEPDQSDAALPIFSITQIELSKPFIPLPMSNEESLLSAIEQINEECEEDEEIRALALKILTVFKKRNSIEAISKMAIYDISANLRAKAVTVLSEFDHESVFETILLACADPSREVRAAAARGLFRLNFERTDAWLRLAESTDTGRVRQAGRAIIAGDLVKPSIERLVHPDIKYASEAFAIVLLLIRAGETEEIFKIFNKNEDKDIRRAILHSFKVAKENNSLEKLYSMLEKPDFSKEVWNGKSLAEPVLR
jgi:HEAT repeats